MFTKILTAALLVAFLVLLLWLLRGVMLHPLKKGRGTEMTMVLRVRGDEPSLEYTLEALLWLIKSGSLPADVLIVDEGMSEETRELAQLFERSYGCIALDSKDKV